MSPCMSQDKGTGVRNVADLSHDPGFGDRRQKKVNKTNTISSPCFEKLFSFCQRIAFIMPFMLRYKACDSD